MVGMVPEALRHSTAEVAALLEAPTMLALGHEVGDLWRARLRDPVTTVPLFLLHLPPGNTACRHVPRLGAQRLTASALWHARTRLPLVVWQQWRCRTAAVCEQTTHDEGRWRGHRTFLGDGASFAMPDTPARHEDCGQPRGPRPGCGVPVAPLLALLQPGTGVLLEGLAAPWPTHAMAEVAALQALRRPGDVPVGERAC